MSNPYIRRMVWDIGNAVKKGGRKRGEGWYGAHMAAASRAIARRIPLVDAVVEVRDARIPLSSQYHYSCLLNDRRPSSPPLIVFNKMDLASRSHLKEWIKYFEQRNCIAIGVNSHNRDSVKELLNFLQAYVRESKRTDHLGCTTTVMIVGFPNVGKSALANSLHQIGRITAAEKGKLKRATVSPLPGETKDISSLKIGSHPNIYVLDTPGILPPEILDIEVCSKLALTGVVRDCLVGEKDLAQYFLAILNSSDQYKKWEKFSTYEREGSCIQGKKMCSGGACLNMNQRKQYPTDHTQDFIIHDVRQALSETISCFDGSVQNLKDMESLIEVQFAALREVFGVSGNLGNDSDSRVAGKVLNLYRTGRLGHYTLDNPPRQGNIVQALEQQMLD